MLSSKPDMHHWIGEMTQKSPLRTPERLPNSGRWFRSRLLLISNLMICRLCALAERRTAR